MVAAFNTQVAASTGLIGWVLVDYFKHGRKFSVIGACEGVIAGLVGITPGAGYVSPWCAAAIGFLTAAIIALIPENLNDLLRVDDGLEVFKLHGIGGMLGSFWTGIFATASVSALDGFPSIYPGGIDGNAIQVGKQFAEITAISSYSLLRFRLSSLDSQVYSWYAPTCIRRCRDPWIGLGPVLRGAGR